MYLAPTPRRRLSGLGVVTAPAGSMTWRGGSRSFGPRRTTLAPTAASSTTTAAQRHWPRIAPTQAATVTTAQQSAATGYIVPPGTPLNTTYADPSGNVWAYNPAAGKWALSITATATGSSAATDPSAAVAAAGESSYQSILDWLSQQTLIGGVPNWVIGAGVVFAYSWISRKGGR